MDNRIMERRRAVIIFEVVAAAVMAMWVVAKLGSLLTHSPLVNVVQLAAAVAIPSAVALLDWFGRRLMRRS